MIMKSYKNRYCPEKQRKRWRLYQCILLEELKNASPKLRIKKTISERGCCGYGGLWFAIGHKRTAAFARRRGKKRIAMLIERSPDTLGDFWVTWCRKELLDIKDRKDLGLDMLQIKQIAMYHNVTLTDVTQHYEDKGIMCLYDLLQNPAFWNKNNTQHTAYDSTICRNGGTIEWWGVVTGGHFQVICTDEKYEQLQVFDQGGKLNAERMARWPNEKILLLYRIDHHPF